MAMTPEQRRKLSELVGGEVDEIGNITWPDGKRSFADQPRVVDMQQPMQSGTGYMRSSSGNEYQFTPQGVFQGGQQIKRSVDPEFVPNYSRNPVDLSEVGIGDKTWRVKGKPNMYMSADGTVYDLNQRPLQTDILAQQKQEAEIDKLRSEAEKNRRVDTVGAGTGKLSTFDSKQLDRSMKASESAAGVVGLLEQARGLYGKYKSSRAEPILGGLARVGASLGMGGERARDYELGEQIAKDLGVIKLGLIGGSDTERELQVAIDTSPSPDKTVAANEKIIENALRAAQILQQYPDFQIEWINRYGSLSRVNEQGEPLGKAWRRYQKESFQPVSDDATAPEKKSNLNQQDMEALNWAMKNPNDPRAAQIKQRLGAR